MVEKNIFAGFGGQGVLLMGQLLAAAGMMEGKHTTWVPSYGPEMRGGTANCSVMLSDEEIDSPLITRPTSLIVMNRPSLEKFESKVVPGGSIFVNSSMIDLKVSRTDVNAYYVPCNDLAAELGNNKVANMIMLGAYLGKSKCVDVETVLEALLEKLGQKKAKLIPLNREALLRGAACIE
ncbi:MAG: 2-oxoacid:acceptor oxidoreductase family protein [Oscillospiraceae bacterium]|nr:2-oxoacid:acceptor oxidoreductase family protein [Oscillospiraceae bacterium]